MQPVLFGICCMLRHWLVNWALAEIPNSVGVYEGNLD